MKMISRRPDVELLEICGEYLLVATREARDACPYVTQINEVAASYWKLLDQPMTVNDLIERISVSFGKEKKAVFLPALGFVSKLSKSGYLIEEDVE